MIDDPIVEEIRQFRDAYAAKFNYDIDAIYEDIKRQQKLSGRTYIAYPPRLLDTKEPQSHPAPAPPDAPPAPEYRVASPLPGDAAINDPIVAEIRSFRDAHAAKFNYDLDAIYEDLKQQQRASGRIYVSYPPRLIGAEDGESAALVPPLDLPVPPTLPNANSP